MTERESKHGISKYSLMKGFNVEYDPSRVLLPDKASEIIGVAAANVVDSIRIVAEEPLKEVRILELGVGAGVGLLSAANNSKNKSNIAIHGMDIEPYCVDVTQRNLDRLIATFDGSVTTDIWEGDWLEESTWDRLAEQQYHVILFNPPYLPVGHDPGEAYATVPAHMMFTADEDGQQHYRHVMPQLGALLSEDHGSSILIRRSSRLGFSHPDFRGLVGEMMAGTKGGATLVEELYPVEDGRLINMACVTRTDWPLPPHKEPSVIIAMHEGKDEPVKL